jgi:glycosyltransferase involved in cell wall biosynthesis
LRRFGEPELTIRRPHIAYITLEDAKDRRALSGAPFYVGKSLQKHVGDVDYIGPLKSNYELPLKIFAKFIQMATLGKRQYRWYNNKILSNAYGRTLTKRIASQKYDLIVAPGGSVFLPYLDTDVPIIYMSDATFRIMIDYNSAFRYLLNISLREGDNAEKWSLDKASLVFYSSEWAAKSAHEHYHVDKKKIKIISYGANIDAVPARDYILKTRSAKVFLNKACVLLFLAVDWVGKGGKVAYETAQILRSRGIETKLIVCGCVPPKEYHKEFVEIIPYLNKNVDEHRKKFEAMILESDFLILPTKFDCTPHVLCEAAAYGLPSLASNTGGISTIIRHKFTGYLIAQNEAAQRYAENIQHLYSNHSEYQAVVLGSRDEYEKRLNWDAWGLHAKKEIASMLVDRKNN